VIRAARAESSRPAWRVRPALRKSWRPLPEEADGFHLHAAAGKAVAQLVVRPYLRAEVDVEAAFVGPELVERGGAEAIGAGSVEVMAAKPVAGGEANRQRPVGGKLRHPGIPPGVKGPVNGVVQGRGGQAGLEVPVARGVAAFEEGQALAAVDLVGEVQRRGFAAFVFKVLAVALLNLKLQAEGKGPVARQVAGDATAAGTEVDLALVVEV